MRYLTLLLFSLGLFAGASAQKYYNDAQFRFNLGINWKLNDKFTLLFDQQDRWYKNVTEFTRAAIDVGIQYKITQNVRIRADYVFITKRNNSGYFMEKNWYYVALFLKHRINKWDFTYRNLAQARHGNINSEEKQIVRYYDRNKLTIRHETTRRAAFWVAGEIYIPLNHPNFIGVDRVRGQVGVTIKTFKNQNVEPYFLYQAFLTKNKWFDQNYPYPTQGYKRYFIYGVNYNIEF